MTIMDVRVTSSAREIEKYEMEKLNPLAVSHFVPERS
jgi:hypothetical protein